MSNGKYFPELLQNLVSLAQSSVALTAQATGNYGTDQLINNEKLEFCPPAVQMLIPWDMTELLCWISVSGITL